ncbi:hypothetical protein LCGC14_2676160 [marine sediment metagenome]|uniref:Uncharacterized protein n=1 Tax=marine sediment metagenome TaxID=412755 RepID=A0A0F8ZMN4_9ZZZZ
MEVTLKNRDIDQGLVLVTDFVKRGLPVKLSFAIAKTTRRLKEVIEVVTDERKKLIEKHQLLDVDGKRTLDEAGNIQFSDPVAFADDFRELMKQENTVDVHQVDYEKLTKMKDMDGKFIRPSPEEMEGLLLLQMIKEPEEDKEEEEGG